MIDITNLAEFEENNRIEAKKAKGGLPSSIWETYSSFANTDGGIILLGVDESESHKLFATGVEDVRKLESDFWNTINNRQKVNVNILTNKAVKVHDIEGRKVLSIEVPRADRKFRPVYVGTDPMKGTYRRDFEGDYLCTKDQVAAMYRDASDVSIDHRVLKDLQMDVFDEESVSHYRNRFNLLHPTHIWNGNDDELFLRHIGAVSICPDDMMFHPTAAGLLMFGREYDIVREFPHYFLDYQEHMDADTRWTYRITSSSGDWSGNLYVFFFRILPRLVSDLPIPFATNGINRKDENKLHIAVREVLLNALAHADHYGRMGIVVTKSNNGMTISNPGDIRIGLKVALQGGVSDPRNESIMKMFSLIGIGERAGSGIPDMMATWETYLNNTPQYVISANPSRTKISLPYTLESLQEAGNLITSDIEAQSASKCEPPHGEATYTKSRQPQMGSGMSNTKGGLTAQKSGISDTAKAILQLLEENPKMTYDELSVRLGKARSGIAKHIKKLREKGLL